MAVKSVSIRTEEEKVVNLMRKQKQVDKEA